MAPNPERYATLALLKAQLTIADTSRDALLTAALATSSNRVETYCGRVFSLDASATARTFDPDRRIACRPGGAEVFLVDDIGDDTTIVVETGYYSSATWTTTTDYATDRPSAVAQGYPVTGLLRAYGWYTGPANRLRVTAKWGWPLVPEAVVGATLILATRIYKRKDSPDGTTGSAEWGSVRIARSDWDVIDLLGPLVKPGFA